jgi:hypothetical protein
MDLKSLTQPYCAGLGRFLAAAKPGLKREKPKSGAGLMRFWSGGGTTGRIQGQQNGCLPFLDFVHVSSNKPRPPVHYKTFVETFMNPRGHSQKEREQ